MRASMKGDSDKGKTMKENNLTAEEQATNAETLAHVRRVSFHLNRVIRRILNRVDIHDDSKLERPEVEIFTEYTGKLAATTYGSQEYKDNVAAMGPALQHHYANNRHHPEHFKNGIDDMNLIDIIEMFCDWKAATERHNDGNLRKSVEINADRFGISPQLVKILENTIEVLGG